MNDIRDLLPGGKMRERTFQLKARRDVGVAWTEPFETHKINHLIKGDHYYDFR